ncbi:MAG TPA: S9 family peptidase [Candidatus Dormibacteraeota bacterium]|nr:S9 family peptidase [Candidatus Dormibacteraeota bacterium]
MSVKRLLPVLLGLMLGLPSPLSAARALAPEDWYRFQSVSDVHVAPDGSAVLYLVTRHDRDAEAPRGAVWLVDWSGGIDVQLTAGENASTPRFSPDGRYVSFLAAPAADDRNQPEGHASSSGAEGKTQLWLLDRGGGAARMLTHVTDELVSYEWSPDGRRIALVMHAELESERNPPQPILIDSYYFKEDGSGYLSALTRPHLYLLEVASGALAPLTADSGQQETAPAWSPDGTELAYVSDPLEGHPDMQDLKLIAARAGAPARTLLRVYAPYQQHLQFSPDGTLLMYLKGAEAKFNASVMDQLMLLDLKAGTSRALTASLDRSIGSTGFAADGRTLHFVVEDEGYEYPAQVGVARGAIEPLGTHMVLEELDSSATHTAVVASDRQSPPEVYALEDRRLRPLTAHNRALFAELALGAVEDIAFKSLDGTVVHGEVVKPVGYVRGRRYPTVLWLHGGPGLQDEHSLRLRPYGPPLERQLFAGHGYLALAVNYRGSSGRGARFARGILADWGHKELEDLEAAVDYVIGQGLADPSRLAVGGWSYGGMLTDYLIAHDTRFKAAISGGASGNQLAGYGTDEYIVQYDAELGPPWRNPGVWMKVSYPLLHAGRIRTPTLFLHGERDFNVPIAGSEQLYQALRTQGVPTQLVIYPGQAHEPSRPSFLADRWRRYLEWLDRYLSARP